MEMLAQLLPYMAYFLAVIPPVIIAKHWFAFLASRTHEQAKLERLIRSLEGTDPNARADILRALSGEDDREKR
jgi:hypothetical protein